MDRINIHISIIGIIYLCLLMIPNIIWLYNQPIGYSSKNENKYLLLLEKIGEILVTCFAIVHFHPIEYTMSIYLFFSIVLIILYECYWMRYFTSEHTLEYFYGSFLQIPVPGATLPILAFVLLGIASHCYLLVGSSLILGIGHIGIHLQHEKEMR